MVYRHNIAHTQQNEENSRNECEQKVTEKYKQQSSDDGDDNEKMRIEIKLNHITN